MPYDLSDKLVIGISSRALFELEEEDRIYRKLGLERYREYQLEKEDELLEPGTAFPLIQGLLALNRGERRVEVIIVSKNHPETGLRMFRSIDHFGLDVVRAAFTGGETIVPYLQAFGVDLFLSRSVEDVQEAIDAGVPAAVLYNQPESSSEVDALRIAFDADAVLFSEESEAIYKAHGLDAFLAHERENAEQAMQEGPLARLLLKLSALQRGDPEDSAVRIAIVTARNSPAHERVIKTLRAWGVPVDAAFFLGGISKDRVLEAYRAHIFFDDQEAHLSSASRYVPSALVPYRSTSVLRAPPESPPGQPRAEDIVPPPAPDDESESA